MPISADAADQERTLYGSSRCAKRAAETDLGPIKRDLTYERLEKNDGYTASVPRESMHTPRW